MKQRGFTLIELVVVLVIMAILLAVSVSSFSAWIRNMRIRAAAESVITGLELAKSEALKRNTGVRFSLVDSLGGGCALVANSTDASAWNWMISIGDPIANSCPDTTAAAITSSTATTYKTIQLRIGAEASGGNKITVNASQASVTFDGLARANSAAVYQISSGATASCAAAGESVGAEGVRCLNVVVSSPGGEVRMCDPAVATASDPRKCD